MSLIRERVERMRQRPPVTERLEAVDRKVAQMPKLGDLSLAMERADGSDHHVLTTGALDPDSRFAAGSVTKLFTHAIIFKLIDEKKLSYDTTVASRVPAGSLDGLHVIRGEDFGSEITVRHLIDMTSGLASWEDAKDPGGRDVIDQIVDWDRVVGVDEQMETAARIGAKFAPGQGNRAHYSDLNAELLSQIAQHTTGMTYQELAYQYVMTPLELEHTTFVRAGVHDYAEVRTPKHPVWSSRYLSSSLGSAGILSTAVDLVAFIRAFHTGRLFELHHIQNPTLRRIQHRPLRYGNGMQAMGLPKVLSPLVPAPLILGHTGVHGAFAFSCPSQAVFIAGSVNSIETQPFEVIYRYLDAY
ncbi:MAG: serine hydrolase domain-containing protein [Corynebacterium sp.]|uniref:serine hydrolase domain-containing protein n=1 Tax=Corynebacterium sp. TaxID=1720 RepID=UPI0026DF7FDF|nr:serine hydrolase domain-containing protein [Corynebacterium sp.]MDO5670660.1 serine hydrolase domain-containing protein [Corynebacterium sp.]